MGILEIELGEEFNDFFLDCCRFNFPRRFKQGLSTVRFSVQYCISGEHLGSHARMILVVRFESCEKNANNEFGSAISFAISAHPPSIIDC
jgi:hypothetical protein